jgi:hypothetical protein
MDSLKTALFYFGWFAIAAASVFVVHYIRVGFSACVGFWKMTVHPVLNRFAATILIGGMAVTLFGTLLCAASTRWFGITDVYNFAAGVSLLVVGMIATTSGLRRSYDFDGRNSWLDVSEVEPTTFDVKTWVGREPVNIGRTIE